MNACVTQRVLPEALDIVNGFGWGGVANKLGVERARVVRRLQGKTEVVHGEDVFEEFRFLEIADAVRLARGIELMCKLIGARLEVMIILGLLNAYSPYDDRGII